jgi:hemerythrin
MTVMSWRREYEVGVPQIDAEHRSLFDLVNEFHETYMRGDSRKEIPVVLNRLITYAEAHFQHEEKLMEEIGYPQIERQRKEHADLVTSIFAINENLATEPAHASRETVRFIKAWLLDHIVKDDMDIGDFLRHKSGRESKTQPNTAGAQPKQSPTGSSPAPKSVNGE